MAQIGFHMRVIGRTSGFRVLHREILLKFGDIKMMNQFYVWQLRGVIYLCLRDCENPWYGQTLRRLDK